MAEPYPADIRAWTASSLAFELQSRYNREEVPTWAGRYSFGGHMDTTTLLIIVIVLLLLGGGWYGRGRWY
jgi:hypothetical protein